MERFCEATRRRNIGALKQDPNEPMESLWGRSMIMKHFDSAAARRHVFETPRQILAIGRGRRQIGVVPHKEVKKSELWQGNRK